MDPINVWLGGGDFVERLGWEKHKWTHHWKKDSTDTSYPAPPSHEGAAASIRLADCLDPDHDQFAPEPGGIIDADELWKIEIYPREYWPRFPPLREDETNIIQRFTPATKQNAMNMVALLMMEGSTQRVLL